MSRDMVMAVYLDVDNRIHEATTYRLRMQLRDIIEDALNMQNRVYSIMPFADNYKTILPELRKLRGKQPIWE